MLPPHPLMRTAVPFALATALLLATHAASAADDAPKPPAGFNPERHMRLGEVEKGMRGYGLSVFGGTQIETFPVEVISVQHGFGVNQSVVWVRCPGDRMQKTGPVQGMSGSPIYLWPNEQAAKGHQPGEGGKLLGAFAYGHTFGKDCYAGIQPIEQMLEAAGRAETDGGNEPQRAAADVSLARQVFTAAFRLAERYEWSDQQTWRLEAMSELIGYEKPPDPKAALQRMDQRPRHQLMLPVTVGSQRLAEAIKPMLAPHGLSVRAGPGGAGSQPPPWIDAGQIEIEPGAPFAMPLTFGPLELSAMGTTTDVLEDGTVLALGHQFFAEGATKLPMATGFIHFVQPNLRASFKVGGAAEVRGAVVRDETAGVVGRPDAEFPTVPATVNVRWAGENRQTQHEYRLVRQRRLLPALVAVTASSSLTRDTQLPQLNTLEYEAGLRFTGPGLDGPRTIRMRTLTPNAGSQSVMSSIAPLVAALSQSEYGAARLQRVTSTVTVRPEVRKAMLVNVNAERDVVRPGDEVVVHARLNPFGGGTVRRTLRMQLPEDAEEGKHKMIVGGAKAYYQQRVSTRPHLRRANDLGELFDALQYMLDVPDDSLFAAVELKPGQNVAVGRQELPNLPSSRQAMLSPQSSTRTTPFTRSVTDRQRVPWVIPNRAMLPITVRKAPGEKEKD